MFWLLPWEDTNHRKHLPLMVWLVMALNIGVFLVFLGASEAVANAWFDQYALHPNDPRWYQFLTANFMHAGLMHLLGNMMFLYLFGDNVEDAFGPLGFLLLYLLGGFLGDLVFVAANGNLPIGSVGASGCIATVAGAYAVLFARHQCSVRLMFVVYPVWRFRLDAIWLLLIWFASDLYQTVAGAGRLSGGGVNFVAHGIGFMVGFGAALVARLQGVMDRYESLEGWHAFFGYLPPDGHPAYGEVPERSAAARRRAALRRRGAR